VLSLGRLLWPSPPCLALLAASHIISCDMGCRPPCLACFELRPPAVAFTLLACSFPHGMGGVLLVCCDCSWAVMMSGGHPCPSVAPCLTCLMAQCSSKALAVLYSAVQCGGVQSVTVWCVFTGSVFTTTRSLQRVYNKYICECVPQPVCPNLITMCSPL
jgi:hypothetical protein